MAVTAGASTPGSADDCFAVTPHDVNLFARQARGFYVGTTGNVTIVTPSGAVVLFAAVPAGTTIWASCKRINATGTTASNIVGLI